ncbi:MAG TPA: Rrf2 family transcriptional regulator [Acidimicrobiales bacterium]|nr:Rrf2 family transcriptional regulator [Acidimicrobiales bacterium]
MYISARVDYATRALLVLAAAEDGRPIKGESVANAQGMPVKVVENTLTDLRRAGLVTSHRGNEGGYRLARPASEIAVADVFRALEGPLAEVHGLRPDERTYEDAAEHLQSVWVAVRAALRSVLERTTLADIVSGALPKDVAALIADPDAWDVRPLGAAARDRGR